jgi:hypothetical protein
MYLNKLQEDLTNLFNFLIIPTELRVGLSKKLKKGGNADGYREMASLY